MNRRFLTATALVAAVWAMVARSDGQEAPSTATVYTANNSSESASVLDGSTLDQVVPDIDLVVPNSVSVSPDGARVYLGTDDGALEVIDGATDTFVTSVALNPMTEIAVSPDGTKVYAALGGQGSVAVVDAVALTAGDTFPLPNVASNTPRPIAIDVTPDGQSLFVLDAQDGSVVKMRASDGASQGAVDAPGDAVELKVSRDGSTLIMVGDSGPQFLRTSDLQPVVGASTDDLGSQTDVAVAGTHAYVLNKLFSPPSGQQVEPAKSKPKIAPLTPSIDVYDMLTGSFAKSIPLPAAFGVLGIAVTSDEATAYVSHSDSENPGSVTAVDVASGTIGVSGSTGQDPVRVAVREASAIPVVSYFLPRVVALTLKGAGKDQLVASGTFDDGGQTVDYAQPATVSVGGYQSTFTLVPNAGRTLWTFRSADKKLQFTITPNVRHSSRGKFHLKVSKSTLSGLIDPNAPVEFDFTASGLPDAEGEVTLQQGRYRINHVRGTLALPPFYPASAKSKLGAENKDTLLFKGGFATNGPIPAQLSGTVRFGFGPTYARTIPGSQFTGPTNGVFKYADKNGKSKFSIQIDFLKELVTVNASGIELGALGGAGTTDVTFDAGSGAGTFRNTIRLSSTSPTHANY